MWKEIKKSNQGGKLSELNWDKRLLNQEKPQIRNKEKRTGEGGVGTLLEDRQAKAPRKCLRGSAGDKRKSYGTISDILRGVELGTRRGLEVCTATKVFFKIRGLRLGR